MPNQVTRGTAIVGDIQLRSGGKVEKAVVGTIARTDTSAKTLGMIPANAVLTGIRVYGAAASDAASTATISVGYSGGTGVEILNGFDVKTAGTGLGQTVPNAGKLPTVTAVKTITGIYAETGTASSTGGPWTVVLSFVTV